MKKNIIKYLVQEPKIESVTTLTYINLLNLSRWNYYVFAVVVTAAMIYIRVFITVSFSDRPFLILYMLPVILSSAFGGFGPGIVSTLISSAATAYLMHPTDSFYISQLFDRIQWSVFIINGLLVSFLSGILHNARRRIESDSEKLRVSEARYRSTLDEMLEGCQIIGFDWKYLYVNGEAVKQSRKTSEELIGKYITEVYPDFENTEIYEKIKLCMTERVHQRIRNRFVYSDRQFQWFNLLLQPVDEGVLIMSEDITKQVESEELLKKTELELIKSEERYRNTLDNMLEGCQIIGFDWKYLYVNNSVVKHGRKTREELIGHTMMSAYPGIENTEIFRLIKSTLEERIPHNMLNEFVYPDSQTAWFNLTIEPVPEGAFILSFDITEQVKAENALRVSENKLRLLIEHAPASLAMFDTDMRYLAVSRRWIDDYHLEINEIVGLSHYELFPEIPERWKEIHRRAMKGEIVKSDEDSFIRIDGTTQWLRWEVHPWNNADGKIGGIIILSEDISKRKQAEEDLKKLNSELEQRILDRTEKLQISNEELETANRDLEAFTYSVSHDLRTPLRAATGYAEILLEDYSDRLDDEGKNLLNTISSSIEKMGRLIDDLLAFSRLGKREIRRGLINMQSLFETVCEELKSMEKGRSLEIKLNPLPDANGDIALIREVITNLLTNAFKYTGRTVNAIIEIGSYSDKDETVYYVKDNGAGFDMKYASKLFEVFQRLHETGDFPGSGVGLAIVKRIIDHHNGRVWAEGSTGGGATFYFSLPVVKNIGQ